LEHFGASASHTKLFEEFGFTVENVVAASLRTLAKVK
jgi:transketolase